MVSTVLITNASGSLAQGVIPTWKKKQLPIRVVGLQTQDLSVANLFCDAVYTYPKGAANFEDPDFSFLVSVCKKEGVRLIIPTTDEETVSLHAAVDDLPEIGCCNEEVSSMFYDKFLTWQAFEAKGIPFAKSYLPSSIGEESIENIIVKPRKGGLSRDIYRNPRYPTQFSDDFIIQELIAGKEITVGFYVTSHGKLHGHITFERSLSRGSTSSAIVVKEYDDSIRRILESICVGFNLKGCANLQAIVTDDCQVIPFEVNARISGSNAARVGFGFSDTVWLINDFCFGIEPPDFIVNSGVALASSEFLIVPLAGKGCITLDSGFYRV